MIEAYSTGFKVEGGTAQKFAIDLRSFITKGFSYWDINTASYRGQSGEFLFIKQGSAPQNNYAEILWTLEFTGGSSFKLYKQHNTDQASSYVGTFQLGFTVNLPEVSFSFNAPTNPYPSYGSIITFKTRQDVFQVFGLGGAQGWSLTNFQQLPQHEYLKEKSNYFDNDYYEYCDKVYSLRSGKKPAKVAKSCFTTAFPIPRTVQPYPAGGEYPSNTYIMSDVVGIHGSAINNFSAAKGEFTGSSEVLLEDGCAFGPLIRYTESMTIPDFYEWSRFPGNYTLLMAIKAPIFSWSGKTDAYFTGDDGTSPGGGKNFPHAVFIGHSPYPEGACSSPYYKYGGLVITILGNGAIWFGRNRRHSPAELALLGPEYFYKTNPGTLQSALGDDFDYDANEFVLELRVSKSWGSADLYINGNWVTGIYSDDFRYIMPSLWATSVAGRFRIDVIDDAKYKEVTGNWGVDSEKYEDMEERLEAFPVNAEYYYDGLRASPGSIIPSTKTIMSTKGYRKFVYEMGSNGTPALGIPFLSTGTQKRMPDKFIAMSPGVAQAVWENYSKEAFEIITITRADFLLANATRYAREFKAGLLGKFPAYFSFRSHWSSPIGKGMVGHEFDVINDLTGLSLYDISRNINGASGNHSYIYTGLNIPRDQEAAISKYWISSTMYSEIAVAVKLESLDLPTGPLYQMAVVSQAPFDSVIANRFLAVASSNDPTWTIKDNFRQFKIDVASDKNNVFYALPDPQVVQNSNWNKEELMGIAITKWPSRMRYDSTKLSFIKPNDINYNGIEVKKITFCNQNTYNSAWGFEHKGDYYTTTKPEKVDILSKIYDLVDGFGGSWTIVHSHTAGSGYMDRLIIKCTNDTALDDYGPPEDMFIHFSYNLSYLMFTVSTGYDLSKNIYDQPGQVKYGDNKQVFSNSFDMYYPNSSIGKKILYLYISDKTFAMTYKPYVISKNVEAAMSGITVPTDRTTWKNYEEASMFSEGNVSSMPCPHSKGFVAGFLTKDRDYNGGFYIIPSAMYSIPNWDGYYVLYNDVWYYAHTMEDPAGSSFRRTKINLDKDPISGLGTLTNNESFLLPNISFWVKNNVNSADDTADYIYVGETEDVLLFPHNTHCEPSAFSLGAEVRQNLSLSTERTGFGPLLVFPMSTLRWEMKDPDTVTTPGVAFFVPN